MPDFSDNNLNQIRTIVREEIREETGGLSVQYEEINSKLDQALESLTSNLNVKNQVDDHEDRITQLETDGKLAKSVITLHSKQLGETAL